VNFDTLLSRVAKPSRYCGNEFNSIKKDWRAATLRFALIFPDLYEIGMSHQGLLILYHLLNSKESWLAERAYAPDLDFERLLKDKGLPLFSLESRRPLSEFDVLGITLPYELCSTNILTILDLAGLPFRSIERDNRHPLIIGGGSSSFQAEPVADFFDAILIGDGEEAILEIAGLVEEAKTTGLSRVELLQGLSSIEGVYVPRFFVPHYDQEGRFHEITPILAGYEKVHRRILPDLDKMGHWPPPLVPSVKIIHDRLGVEIARGCTRGCRFCQAGIIYRPVRERSVETILSMARDGVRQGGFEEMALLSLSTGDYSCLSELLVKLMDSFVKERVSVSMPSMRVGTLTPEIMAQIKRVRKTGFTLAPEAGTDRLRRVINKGITEEDLLATVETAFGLGWNLLKFYFMFGLPTETIEDVEAIAALVHKSFAKGRGSNRRINVSVATFVPKPHTPFQWAGQLDIATGFSRIDLLKKKLANRKIALKWHDPRQSFLEGVLARGDRRLSGVIEEAWLRGARLDAWSDHFCLDIWRQAAGALQVNLDSYTKPLAFTAPLPWQHLDVGVDAGFFKQEYERALTGEYTPDCRVQGCQKCGLCDFKRIFPRTQPSVPVETVLHKPLADKSLNEDLPGSEVRGESRRCHVYRLEYAKVDSARLLSHLEMLQVFFRAFRRVGLPLRYSQGFNPTPRVSFSPALPLGTESHAEHVTIELSAPLVDLDLETERLNRELPRGVVIKKIESALKKSYQHYVVCYEIILEKPLLPADLEAFMGLNEWILQQERKKSLRLVDARPLVRELSLADSGNLRLVLVNEAGKPGIKPLELVQAIKKISDEEMFTARVVKMWAQET